MKINTGNEEFEKLLSFKPKIFPPKKALKKSRRMKNQLRNEEVSSTLMGFTGYSQEEIVTWFSQFQQLCPSGLLTRKKILRLLEEDGRSRPDTLADNILAVFDTEGRGGLSFDQFIAAAYQSEIATPEIKLRWQFQLYDCDRSGNINEEEFVQIFVQIFEGENTGQSGEERELVIDRAKEMFAELDDSRDGEVSQEEFVEGCMKDEDLVKMLTEN